MLYVATAQPPTVQLEGITSSFLSSSPTETTLIINKLSSLELYSFNHSTSTLSFTQDIPINGTISSLSHFTLPSHSTSSLLILTTSLQLFTLDYNHSTHSIHTSNSINIFQPAARLADYITIFTHPSSISLHVYNGILHTFPLPTSSTPTPSKNLFEKLFQSRLPSLNVTSLTYLPSPSLTPTIAVLSSSSSGSPTLSTYTLSLRGKSQGLSPGGPINGKIELVDPGAELVIPVVGGRGVIVVGEGEIVWIEWEDWVDEEDGEEEEGKAKGKRKARTSVEERKKGKRVSCAIPVGHVVTYAPHPTSPNHFLLGDIYGKLALLTLSRSSPATISSITLKDLGDTSSPTSIVFLNERLIYITSRFADSQLVGLPGGLVGEEEGMEVDGGEEIELIRSFESLAPISDAVLLGNEKGGGTRIVTCSGAYKGGSLRVVRSGVGFNEGADLELEGIRNVWSVWNGEEEVLVLGFWTETRVVTFGGGSSGKLHSGEQGGEEEETSEPEAEEISLPAISPLEPTIFAGNFPTTNLLIQVINLGVRFGERVWRDEKGGKITLAVMSDAGLVLGLEGGRVVLLGETEEGLEVLGETVVENEIASISTSVFNKTPIVVLGLWTTQTILLLSLPTFTQISTKTLSTTFLIRSALITQFSSSDERYLFVGLGDGSLESFVVGERGEIGEGKRVQLGSSLRGLVRFGGQGNLFVVCDRPTVVSRVGDRLRYSGVNLKDIVTLTSFNSSLAVVTSKGVQLGKIDNIQKVDIKTIPLDDDEPRRISFDVLSECFLVVCVRRDIDRVSGVESRRGWVRVMDDENFDLLAEIPLEEEEQGESVCVLTTFEGKTCWIVGTSKEQTSEAEPTSGRLLVIEASVAGGIKSFSISGELKLGGCPYSLAYLSPSYFAVAVNSQVHVYSLQSDNQLSLIAKWPGAFVSLKIVSCTESTILVADAMQSLSLLNFTILPPSLKLVAQDYRANYMSAAQAIVRGDGEPTEFIGAELDLNLFTVEKEDVTTARSMMDEHALSPRGVFHLGEMVSQFCRGSFVPQYGDSSSAAQPRLVFATSAGSLGIIADVDEESSKVLADLERNMRRVIPAVGDLDQEKWRAFKSEASQEVPSAGFLDGNFLELFSTLSKKDMEAVLKGGSEHEALTLGSDKLLSLVDELARLH